MRAFHGKEEIKKKYVDRVIWHRKHDSLIQGIGWEDGKGCAVGCTLESYDHARYEIELGIPEWLARVEDTIFEGLPTNEALKWPERFLSAIRPGANLESVRIPFLIYIQEQNLKTLDTLVLDKEKFPDIEKAIDLARAAISQVIACHLEGGDLSAARAARGAAESGEGRGGERGLYQVLKRAFANVRGV